MTSDAPEHRAELNEQELAAAIREKVAQLNRLITIAAAGGIDVEFDTLPCDALDRVRANRIGVKITKVL